MRSPLSSTVVIACPHCGTRYQVPAETIGPHGRQVLCAHCAKAWQAEAADEDAASAPDETDRIFDEAAERELDAAFTAEERAAAAEAFSVVREAPDDAVDAAPADAGAADRVTAIAPELAAPPRGDRAPGRAGGQDFNRRQDSIARKLPLARVRRSVRLASLALLTGLIVAGGLFRTDLVRTFPDLAGAYAALGLGVNIVGLEFREVTTVLALRDGAPVLQVEAHIDSVTDRNVAVPPVVVSLLDTAGRSLYEWSVQPEAPDLEPGEAVAFSTRLTAPPAAATQVRLRFANSPSGAQTPPTAISNGTP